MANACELSSSVSKRLGHLADKITLHHSKAAVAAVTTRADSGQTVPSNLNPNSMASVKAQSSPAKAVYNRTYDSKLVSREMHRLGNLAHLPAGLAPSISQAPSSSSLSMPAPATIAQSNLNNPTTDPWGALHVHVLPLFNGEQLRMPIEDLNILVRRHISSTISSSPSKALASLENDASELIVSGMATLNAKLNGVEEEKLVGRVVEIWGFFWDQVLPYIEGVLLPLQTDPLLSSLHRTPKRPSSPNRQGSISGLSSTLSSYPIDVRTVALRAFRDKVILQRATKLHSRISLFTKQQESLQDSSYQQPRLQQMLLVLSALGRLRPPPLSLTAPAPAPTTGEAAIADLLRVVGATRPSGHRAPSLGNPLGKKARAPSFLSGAIPRDRRGRIAQKQKTHLVGLPLPEDSDDSGDEMTPRHAGILLDYERERERAMLLESLRSPGPDSAGARGHSGGWGLGITHDQGTKPAEEDDEPELNWDQAQELVEKMVGMDSQPQPPDSARKRT